MPSLRWVRFVISMLSVGAVALAPGAVSGQNYPYKPIRVIAGLAGGGGDFNARIIAQGISGPLGQPVIVENRPSLIVAELGAKALPDGYTLIVQGASLWVGPLFQKSSWDVVRDFAAISRVSREVFILAVNPSVAANSVKELIALAKAKPGVLNFGAGAAGAPGFLGGELFKAMAGINIVRVNYKGTVPSVTALAGGEVQMVIADVALVLPLAKSGKLRALAVTSADPSTLAPGMPTVAATGLPGFELLGATGVWVPVNTPAAVINRLNQEIVRVVTQPDVKERFFNTQQEVVASSPESFAATIKSDIAKWSKLMKDAGIQME